MKAYERMKEIELQLAGALRQQLERIPSLEIRSITAEAELQANGSVSAPRPDVLAQVRIHNHEVTLVCEVKDPAYPRQVRQAIDTLSLYMVRSENKALNENMVPLVAASWLSPDRAKLRGGRMGWLDLAGGTALPTASLLNGRRQSAKWPPATIARVSPRLAEFARFCAIRRGPGR